MVSKKYFHVAGMTIAVHSARLITDQTFHPKFRDFAVPGPGNNPIAVHHHFYAADDPELRSGKKIYDKNQWVIYQTSKDWIFHYTPKEPGDLDYSVIGRFNHSHTCVDIYAEKISSAHYQTGLFNALTLFPNDQILFARLLFFRLGAIIHANGFNINGKGILLSGISGSGKSTLSQMFMEKGFTLLCDDRMFLKKKDRDFWIFGNWCHGSDQQLSLGTAPLSTVFFLKKSHTNQIVPIGNRQQLLEMVLQSLVRPLLFSYEWDIMLTTVTDIIRKVPCYVLEFDLSGEICDMIVKFLHPKG